LSSTERRRTLPAVTETLRDAQILAEFSNLEPGGVEYFRHNYADFVPQSWWDYQSDRSNDEIQWQFNQGYLRRIWEGQFADNLHSRMLLTLSVFNPDDFLWILHDFKPAFTNIDNTDPEHYYPYHKAVFFLFDHPWRARFCVECKKRFVAAASQNIHCSEACFHVRRNRQKREWWRSEGSKQRAAKQKKRRNARLPKGPVRATRATK
jgi:hypothetical protein